MNRRVNIIAAVALGFVAAVACAQAPQEDVSAAQAELDKAKQAQADTWAPNEFQAADQAMKAAQDEIQAQNAKWMKNYDKAKELLAKAKEEASKASQAAVANKEQAKKDAEAAIAAADTAIQTAGASLKVAPVTKDSKADLALYKSDIDTLKGTLDQARQAFTSEDYKKALESASSVKDRATSIADKLEEAKKKRSGQAKARKA
ncbi:MAG TPA: hypothetical protein VEO94_05940 [Candidatus Dormibacteraeota bacterium]|nr:hypothetical protein [Candidatus Dormibacteraeota bacterium]